MSDGDEESENAREEASADQLVEEFETRLAEAEDALSAAETEDDLDDVEATLDEIAADLEAAEFEVPEPEDEDEEPEDPKEDLEDDLSALRDDLEEQRGPYGEDVVAAIEAVRTTIADTRWTEEGEDELVPGVDEFLSMVSDILDAEFGAAVADTEEMIAELEETMEAVEEADLDADEDAEVIASLLGAAEDLEAAVEDATAWDDLEVREQLRREGFYEPIESSHFKDFPPEWSALKAWEQRANVEMVTLLLEKMGDSDFLARHCIDALKHIGDPDGVQPLVQRANRRNLDAIDALGKIGAETGVSALEGHAESEGSPELQTQALKALGAIGSEETTELVAQQLLAESDSARSQAARSLGMIGDTRAIDPLADVLSDPDQSSSVRASAAWALYQIGTQEALEAAAEYTDDQSYVVEREATKAASALGEKAEPV